MLETHDDDGLGNGCDTTVETMFASAIAGRSLSAGTYYLQVKHFSPPPPSSPSGTITPYTLEVCTDERVQWRVRVEQHGRDRESDRHRRFPAPIGVRTSEIKPAGDVDYYSVVAAAGSSLFRQPRSGSGEERLPA